MSNQKGFAPIVIVLIFIALLAGGILAWQYFWAPEEKQAEEKSVLCRAQYSASLGGLNEPLSNVSIIISQVDLKIQSFYTTNEYGQVYIPFETGKEYNIEVSYKTVKKNVRLEYNGGVLFISINPHELNIAEIKFTTPLPLEP